MTVWEILKHRNIIVFSNKVVDYVEIFKLVQLNAWSYVKFRGQGCIVHFRTSIFAYYVYGNKWLCWKEA